MEGLGPNTRYEQNSVVNRKPKSHLYPLSNEDLSRKAKNTKSIL